MSSHGAAPRRVGPYLVFDELTRDDLGAIHLATSDPGAEGGWIALRLLRRELADDPPMRAAFLEAMRAGQHIVDERVTRVLGAGSADDGTTWAALEALDGERVESLLTRLGGAAARAPWSCAVSIVAQAARGLAAIHAAHDAGGRPLRLHGQVAPRNLFVTYRGKVKVLEACGPQLAGRRYPDALTAPYRAPEQILAMPVDGRADIYSLGLVLWELTSGKRVDRDGSPLAVATLPDGGATVPAKVQEVLQRATAADVAARYRSGIAMADELATVIAGGIRMASEAELARFMAELFPDRVERHARLRERARARVAALAVHLPSYEDADAGATQQRPATRGASEMADLFDLGEEISQTSIPWDANASSQRVAALRAQLQASASSSAPVLRAAASASAPALAAAPSAPSAPSMPSPGFASPAPSAPSGGFAQRASASASAPAQALGPPSASAPVAAADPPRTSRWAIVALVIAVLTFVAVVLAAAIAARAR